MNTEQTIELQEEADRLIQEAIFSGQMTLRNKKILHLDAFMLINLAKDIQKQAPKAPKGLSLPERYKRNKTS